MSDKIWTIVYIVLGSIIAIMVGYILISISPLRSVDCEKVMSQRSDNNYVPLPKQCEKGEK